MSWYIKVLRNTFQFGGRAQRQEYWMFVLFNILFSAVFLGLDVILGSVDISAMQEGTGILTVYSWILILPTLAVQIRRLHDTDRTGWWSLLIWLPQSASWIVTWFGLFEVETASDASTNPIDVLMQSPALIAIAAASFIGGITHFVFMVLDSAKGENRYGPSTKYGVQDGSDHWPEVA